MKTLYTDDGEMVYIFTHKNDILVVGNGALEEVKEPIMAYIKASHKYNNFNVICAKDIEVINISKGDV